MWCLPLRIRTAALSSNLKMPQLAASPVNPSRTSPPRLDFA